ncbi:MAG: hypothetical protein PHE32_02860 [Candidatus Shapirobacteria bacterium]|nr:hypothetical protein [Candidatus Shapirobacteria bacterium]MDD4410614.1 hypothetical protein [Candidatus Shapirobacteria bacterium]
MECYKINRARVFEIYNIDLNNPNYNCHHIVTREDKKRGIVPPDFDLNIKANLYPSLIRDHNELHRRLDRLESPLILNKEINYPISNFIRVNLIPIGSFLFDPKIIEEIDKPNIREKSNPLKFLVWKRQGIL